MDTTIEDAPGRELMVPATGEVLALNQPSDILAEAVNRMRELERELASVRQTVAEELTRRMDVENLRKADVGDYTISVDAPGALDWDLKKLDEVLDGLVAAGRLSAAAKERVMPPKPSLSQRELKKLLTTLEPDERERVEACSAPSRRTRRVKVELATV